MELTEGRVYSNSKLNAVTVLYMNEVRMLSVAEELEKDIYKQRKIVGKITEGHIESGEHFVEVHFTSGASIRFFKMESISYLSSKGRSILVNEGFEVFKTKN